MRLDQLFESELSDQVARNQAVRVHKQITYWLTQNQDVLSQRLPAIHRGPFAGGFRMDMEMCDLDGDFPDLVVLFVPKFGADIGGGNVAGGGYTKIGWRSYIVIPCLLKPGSTEYLATRFGSGGLTPFVHEFMHYLTQKRNKGAAETSANKLGSNDLSGYYNHPEETNAYYQEAAHRLESFISAVCHNAPQAIEDWYNMSTGELVSYAKKSWVDKQFLKQATHKTIRALDKRLARFIEETIRPMLDKVVRRQAA